METIPCPVCGGTEHSPFLLVRDRLNQTQNEEFQLVKCGCTFVFLNPRPIKNEIGQYYQNEAYDPHREKSFSLMDTAYNAVQFFANRQKLKRISEYSKRGSMLDVGAGQGDFGQFMDKNGWSVSLCDPFSEYNGELNFYNDISKVSEEDSFDLITLWHVLEHLHDLEFYVSKMFSMLDEQGIMVLAVPNIHANERQYYGKNWAPYDAPRHLYHFSEITLHVLLNKHGFIIEESFAMPQDTPYNILLSMKNKSIMQIIKAVYVCIQTWWQTMINGPESASTIMVICRKK